MISLTSGMRNASLRAGSASFPVALRPVFTMREGGEFRPIDDRRAIVRTDTGEAISVVSDRYTLVQHATIIARVEESLDRLGLGTVPRAVHMFKHGAVMKALFKIEPRQFDIGNGDMLCPMIRAINSYDASQRVTLELGAFRRVCTNLSIGGGGIFATGFASIHAGKIDVNKTADQMGETLESFNTLAAVFKGWRSEPFAGARMGGILVGLQDNLPKKHNAIIADRLDRGTVQTVWDAYNVGTEYATHGTRTAGTAYRVLAAVNKVFNDAAQGN